MFLASASSELKVYNCEVDEWKVQVSLGRHVEPIQSIRWSDDGRYILQVSCDKGTEILRVDDDALHCKNVQRISVRDPTVAAFYHHCSRYVAVGSREGHVRVWDTPANACSKTLSPVRSPIKFLDLNPNNTILAAGCDSGEIVYYGLSTNNRLGAFRVPHCNSVSSLLFHPELKSLVAVATEEGSVLLRDLIVTKDRMFSRDAHSAPVTGVTFSPVNRDVMVSCGLDRRLLVHDVRLQTGVSTVETDYFLTCVSMNAHGLVGCGTSKGEIVAYDLRNYKKPSRVLRDHPTKVTGVLFRPSASEHKKNPAVDVSLKGVTVGKSTPTETADCNTSHDWFMAHMIDRTVDSQPDVSPTSNVNPKTRLSKVVENDTSYDSFMADVIDRTVDSEPHVSVTPVADPRSKLSETANGSKAESHLVSTSTPIESVGNLPVKNRLGEVPTPSPIVQSGTVRDRIPGPYGQKRDPPPSEKYVDSPEHESAAETVKCDQRHVSEVVGELKDYIRHSIEGVLYDNRHNYVQTTMLQVKDRMHVDNQLSVLNDNIETLYHTLQNVLEENKKLRIDVEMLRTRLFSQGLNGNSI